MARRRLLADTFGAGVSALPSEEREVVGHCTLTPDDLALAAIKRGPHSRLGYAMLLLALRHPGRSLEPGEVQGIGLGRYEGRGWRWFHHHASLCIAAYGFLVAERAAFPSSTEPGTSLVQAPAVPEAHRPRGAADPA